MENNMILVAEVRVSSTMDSLFRPLGSALAPLSFYVTPCIQYANYLNKGKYNGKMTWVQFVKLVSKRLGDNINMEINEEDDTIKIFTDKKTYSSSVYSNDEYIDKVYDKDMLPIIFE